MDRKYPTPLLVIFPSKGPSPRWYWRFVSANDLPKAESGRGYSTFAAAEKAARSTLLPPYKVIRRSTPIGMSDPEIRVTSIVNPNLILRSNNPVNPNRIDLETWEQ